MRNRLILILLLSLLGCATPNPIKNTWTPPDSWWTAASAGGGALTARDGSVTKVRAAQIKNLWTVYVDVTNAAGIQATLSMLDMDNINAISAVSRDGRNQIGFSLPLLDQLGDDKDALASIAGHELAHLYFGHGKIRKERTDAARGANRVIGTVMNQIVPFSGLLASLGTEMYINAFSRDEEREADEKGLEWAQKAGYDPCGSARAMRVLERAGKSGSIPFLSSHPGHQERIERAIRFSGKSC